MKVSVVVPVNNEAGTIRLVLGRVHAVPIEREIIVVDDCSTDGTREALRHEALQEDTTILLHAHNQGKGAVVRTGLRAITGDVVTIQDADLEYDPAEYPTLLRPIILGRSKVVYGSRFLGEHKAMDFWHAVGN